MKLRIDTGGPARVEVRGPDGVMYQPPDALRDRSASKRQGIPPWYNGHFVSTGQAVVDVPQGAYTVIAMRGPEYRTAARTLDVKADQAVNLVPQRVLDMASKNWWSADFHLHRPITAARELLLAEDLNLGVFFTMWKKVNLWEGKPLPESPEMRIDARHTATVMNAEDERRNGGGAWMFHNLKQPLAIGVDHSFYPPGRDFAEQAHAQGAWFDLEKPIWWEAPVMAAVTRIDSLGVLHNHYLQYGMFDNEAWGRPRDVNKYPGYAGFSNYSLSLYYHYLNVGNRYPASAGSASGVLPNPPGYNRMYIYRQGPPEMPALYDAVRAGRTFVTNGPMLFLTVDGHLPGDTIEIGSSRPLKVAVHTESVEPVERMELIANGQVIASGSKIQIEVAPKNYTWLAARAYGPSTETIRMAHTSPVYLSGAKQIWNSRADEAFFVAWIDELIKQAEADAGRFENEKQKGVVMGMYRAARGHYARKLTQIAAK